MKYLKAIAAILALVCILCVPISVSAASQGTNGDELQLMQPQKLEIQLGAEWAGVEFELKTDAGMYPGTIPVGADGVLRLEIGGSESYILTCINSSVKAPTLDETVPDAGEPGSDPVQNPEETDSSSEASDITPTEPEGEKTVAGIPVKHIAMFGGGLLVAIGALVGMRFFGKKNARSEEYEDEEY